MEKIVNFNDFKGKKEEEAQNKDVRTREERVAEVTEMMEDELLSAIKMSKEDIKMDAEQLRLMYFQMKDDGREIVFPDLHLAERAADIMLDWPEFQDLSHFEISTCVSKLSSFCKLIPVKRNKDKEYIFPDSDMLLALQLSMIKKTAEQLVQHQDSIQDFQNE